MIDDCGLQIEESLENSAADFKVTHVLLRNIDRRECKIFIQNLIFFLFLFLCISSWSIVKNWLIEKYVDYGPF
jgi:TRAP-type C4-dicarboxylate transport system permease small subunit